MKRGTVNLEMAKPGAVLCQKRGAVVSQLVPKLKESVPPPPRGGIVPHPGPHPKILPGVHHMSIIVHWFFLFS